MRNILFLFSIFFFWSCSFSSNDSESTKKNSNLRTLESALSDKDSDGDLVSDKDELERGTDPYISNIPNISFSFLQNYSIQIERNGENVLDISRNIERDDPRFKFKSNKYLIKEKSFQNAARVARFNNASFGIIDRTDFTWIRPTSEEFPVYSSKIEEYQQINHSNDDILKLNFTNWFKLDTHGLFESISDVKLKFFYYSYSKEKYIQIHETLIDQVLQDGVVENFEIEIINPPLELIEENYLRRGELIICEISDYYIPKLEITYLKLMRSVLNKTTPIYVDMPSLSDIFYVSVDESKKTLIELLTTVYNDNFEIKDNTLVRVKEFENSLSKYEHLADLRESDKDGNWFIFTEALNRDVLDYKFGPNEPIVLTYITGEKLSSQVSQKQLHYSSKVFSSDKENSIDLGSLTENSEIEIGFRFLEKRGIKKISTNERYYVNPHCTGNCSGNWDWWVEAMYSNNSFSEFSEKITSFSDEDVLKSFKLLVDNSEIDLKDLYDRGIVYFYHEEDYFTVKLRNTSLLPKDLLAGDKALTLKLLPIVVGESSEGIEIKSVRGKNIKNWHIAGAIALELAEKHNCLLSSHSVFYEKWKNLIPWGKKHPRSGFIPKRGKVIQFYDGIEANISSKITKFYN